MKTAPTCGRKRKINYLLLGDLTFITIYIKLYELHASCDSKILDNEEE